MREIVIGGTGTVSYETIPLWLAGAALCLPSSIFFPLKLSEKSTLLAVTHGCYTRKQAKVQSPVLPQAREQ